MFQLQFCSKVGPDVVLHIGQHPLDTGAAAVWRTGVPLATLLLISCSLSKSFQIYSKKRHVLTLFDPLHDILCNFLKDLKFVFSKLISMKHSVLSF
jgi:hypothetical protein